MSQSPAIHAAPGAIPVGGAFGSPAQLGKTYVQLDGVKPAGAGWHDYVGRGNLCYANNDTCKARRVDGELFCIGHMRQLKKMQKEMAQDVAPEDVGNPVAAWEPEDEPF